jgi:hypothetical protein
MPKIETTFCKVKEDLTATKDQWGVTKEMTAMIGQVIEVVIYPKLVLVKDSGYHFCRCDVEEQA